MLKRYQVMLEDWQQEYVEGLAQHYDLSISEVIRLEVSLAIICSVSHIFPEYEPGIATEEMLKQALAYGSESSSEGLHNLISQIYFEARKAAEYRKSQSK